MNLILRKQMINSKYDLHEAIMIYGLIGQLSRRVPKDIFSSIVNIKEIVINYNKLEQV